MTGDVGGTETGRRREQGRESLLGLIASSSSEDEEEEKGEGGETV